MKIVKAHYVIETEIDGRAMLKRIEEAGRICYQTKHKITENSHIAFIKMILDPTRRHESVIEHESITVRIICDRGVTHEIVRHRLASYSQESTRYCNYSKEKFGNEITVIDPRPHMDDIEFDTWKRAMKVIEMYYMHLINHCGTSPQMARSVLPNSLKTEIVMTANLREWRHFFNMRASKAAHPQMQEIAWALLADLRLQIPVIFDDVGGDVVEERKTSLESETRLREKNAEHWRVKYEALRNQVESERIASNR